MNKCPSLLYPATGRVGDRLVCRHIVGNLLLLHQIMILSSLTFSSNISMPHFRIKGLNLNVYLETHSTPHNIHVTPYNIYFIRLRILPRVLGTLYCRLDDPLCRGALMLFVPS